MEEVQKIRDVERMFGGGLALNLMMEREMLARGHRLVPDEGDFLGLQVSTGVIDRIDFRDYLGMDNPLKNC